MKKKVLFAGAALFFGLTACRYQTSTTAGTWIDSVEEVAVYQLLSTASELADSMKMPRTAWAGYELPFLEEQLEHKVNIDSIHPNPAKELLGKRRLCTISDWTSGFFPGTLWYAYELTGNDSLKMQAIRFTNKLNNVRYMKGTHDVGFMVNCSYGNALRLTPNDTIKPLLVETANNLCSRFDSIIGCIRSWDFGTWHFPVIIDNMMNLELLFNVSKLTGDPKYADIAVRHARTTMANHFRPDHTCYHVVSYNADGTVERKQTFQGKSDESAWSRGQGWAVYGYTLCYKETKDTAFLQQAIQVADMIIHRTTTSDAIPYWDFDAPAMSNTPRDASAAAVIASAFLDLSTLVPDSSKYFIHAEKILKSLSGKDYLAVKGNNAGFILKHSTGSLPHGSEIDVPLNYADYYYLEALLKYLKIRNDE